MIVTILAVDDAGSSCLSLSKLPKRKVGLGEVMGGSSLSDGTHETGCGRKILLGILEVCSNKLPCFLTRNHLVVITGFLGHVIGINEASEETCENTVGPCTEKNCLCTELLLHSGSGVLNLGMLINHVHDDVGTVRELVHVLTIVTYITADGSQFGPIGENSLVITACSNIGIGKSIQSHAIQNPVV